MKHKQVIYYNSYKDDVIESKNQNIKISDKFKWIHTNLVYNFFSKIIYAVGFIFSCIYSKFVLHIKISNKEILKNYKKTGYFIYGNHTLPIGDVFNPGQVIFEKRFYIIASQSNIGIPVLGKILPMLGALIIPDSMKQMKEFINAVNIRINENKAVIVYPEAHVWPYYTKIRPFDETSFKFPAQLNVPSFCMTTTYYKRRIGKKPGIKIYIDGPFLPDMSEPLNKRKTKLCKEIYQTMKKRSKNSTYEYFSYKKGNCE